jgi:hypothetical protein
MRRPFHFQTKEISIMTTYSFRTFRVLFCDGMPSAGIDFILTDPPYICRYQARDRPRIANDDNARWLRPAFAGKCDPKRTFTPVTISAPAAMTLHEATAACRLRRCGISP